MKLFVDSSAWLALYDAKDEHHKRARILFQRLAGEPTTFFVNDYILDETLTLIRYKVSLERALRFLDATSRSPRVVQSQITEHRFREGEKIFRRYRDKKWSFTDCISFAFMEELGLDTAFAFDKNFAQYGKRVLPETADAPAQ